ncbi:MAG: hypothetical protein AAFW73_16610 [Bacteroidota bacterium]
MKNIRYLLLFLLLSQGLAAQFYEGFEENCADHARAFVHLPSGDCYPQWINTHGTSNTQSDFAGITPAEGNRYVQFYTATYQCNSQGVNNPNFSHGEGIALRYDFVQGQRYLLNYAIRFGGGNGTWSVDWILANDLVEKTGPAFAGCEDVGDVVPPLPEPPFQTLPIADWADSSDDWMYLTEDFVADQDYDYLWLRAENVNILHSDYSSRFYLDAVGITVCNEDLVPEFYTADAQGNPKTDFCFTEDVWVCLDPVEDFTWQGTSFTIRKLPANSFFTKTGVRFDIPETGGCYNLSQFIRQRGNRPFLPEHEYSIQMSINHPHCGWLDRFEKVNIKCCDGDVDASFISTQDGDKTPYTITGQANTDYTAFEGSHEFCLYTDVEEDGVFELVTCQAGTSFLYTGGENGVRYYLVHKVTTVCGEFCDVIDFCRGEDCLPGSSSRSTVDCSIFDPPVCEVSAVACPTRDGNSFILSWTGTPLADQYEVYINPTGANCNCTVGSFQGGVITSNTSYAFGNLGNCFSFRVTPICDGVWGTPSGIFCYPEDCRVSSDGPGKESDGSGGGPSGGTSGGRSLDSNAGTAPDLAGSAIVMTANPNPFDQVIRVEAQQVLDEDVRIVVVDILGKVQLDVVVAPINGKVYYEWLPDAQLPRGAYLIHLIHDGGTETMKTLKL